MPKNYEIEPVWVPSANGSGDIIELNNPGFYLKIIITENEGALTYEFLRYNADTKQWIAQEITQNQAWSTYDYSVKGQRFFYFDHKKQTLYRFIPALNNTIRCDRFRWNGSIIMIQTMMGKEKQEIELKIKPTFPKELIGPTYSIDEIEESDQSDVKHSSKQNIEELICRKDITSVLGDYPYTALNAYQRQMLFKLIQDDWEMLRAGCKSVEEYIAALRHILKGDKFVNPINYTDSTIANIPNMRHWLFLKFSDKLGKEFHINSDLKRKDLYCFLVACIIDELKHLEKHLEAEVIEWSKPEDDTYNVSLSENQAVIYDPNLTATENAFLDILYDFRYNPINAISSINQHQDFIVFKCLNSLHVIKNDQFIIDDAMVKVLQTFSTILSSDPTLEIMEDDEARTKAITQLNNEIFCEFCETICEQLAVLMEPEELLLSLKFGSPFLNLTFEEIVEIIPNLASKLKEIDDKSLAIWCCNKRKFDEAKALMQQFPLSDINTTNLFNIIWLINKGKLGTVKELVKQLHLTDKIINHLFNSVLHALLIKTSFSSISIGRDDILKLLFFSNIIEDPLIWEDDGLKISGLDPFLTYRYLGKLYQHFYGEKADIKLKEFWIQLIFNLDNRALCSNWFDRILGPAIDDGKNGYLLLSCEFKSKIIADLKNIASKTAPSDPSWKEIWKIAISTDSFNEPKDTFWTTILLTYHRPSEIMNPSTDDDSLLIDFAYADLVLDSEIKNELNVLAKQIDMQYLLDTLYRGYFRFLPNLTIINNLIIWLNVEKKDVDFFVKLIVNDKTDKKCSRSYCYPYAVISPYSDDTIDHPYYSLLKTLINKYKNYQDSDGNNLLHLAAKNKSEFLLRAILDHGSKDELIKMKNNQGETPRINIDIRLIKLFKLGLFCLHNKLVYPGLLLEFYHDSSYTTLYKINLDYNSHSIFRPADNHKCDFFYPSLDPKCWLELYKAIHENYDDIKNYMENCIFDKESFLFMCHHHSTYAVFVYHFKLNVLLKDNHWCTHEIRKLELLLRESCNLKEVKQPKVKYLVKKCCELSLLIADKQDIRSRSRTQGLFKKNNESMGAEIEAGRALLVELQKIYNEKLSGTHLAQRIQQSIEQVRQNHPQGFEKHGTHSWLKTVRQKSKLARFCDEMIKDADQYLLRNNQTLPSKSTV